MPRKAKHGLTAWAEEHPDLVEFQTRTGARAWLAGPVRNRRDVGRHRLGTRRTRRRSRRCIAHAARRVLPLIARARYEKSDPTYNHLVYVAKEARTRGGWSRFAFTDGAMPDMYVPSREAPDEELMQAIAELSQPGDPFAGTGMVLGWSSRPQAWPPGWPARCVAGSASTSRSGLPRGSRRSRSAPRPPRRSDGGPRTTTTPNSTCW